MVEAWAVPVAVIVAFAVLFLAPLVEAAGTSLGRVAFFCPFVRHDVTVGFVERWALGTRRAVDVRSCSAFGEGQDLTCGKRCLETAGALPAPEPAGSVADRAR